MQLGQNLWKIIPKIKTSLELIKFINFVNNFAFHCSLVVGCYWRFSLSVFYHFGCHLRMGGIWRGVIYFVIQIIDGRSVKNWFIKWKLKKERRKLNENRTLCLIPMRVINESFYGNCLKSNTSKQTHCFEKIQFFCWFCRSKIYIW